METNEQKKQNGSLKVMISGGGTGGHVFPAIAIAQALVRKTETIDILFVGAKGKMEMEKVPKAGFEIEGLWISGIQRKLSWKNLTFPFKLLSSLWKAWRLIRKFKPDVVVGVGGYASGPTLEVASRLGIPTFIQEQNSFPGITNRLLAKKAKKIGVAYDRMDRFFPRDKLVITGNPVRKDLKVSNSLKAKATDHFSLQPDKPVILIVGGSLGARSLNLSMRKNAGLLRQRVDIQVLWQCGKLYWEEYKDCETAQLPNVEIRAFLDAMDLAYSAADVIICRAGALTISELAIVGKPAILIPSPNVAEDHQTKNAKALADDKAALLIPDTAAETMIEKAIALCENEDTKASLSREIKKRAKPDADDHIADLILNLVPQKANV